MIEVLKSYIAGEWTEGRGPLTALTDPVTGEQLVAIASDGLDLARGFAFVREHGGPALRALPFVQRADLLARIVKTLQAHRDEYFDIAVANSGTTRADSAIDIDGAIFTLGQYARWGAALGEARALQDGARTQLTKDGSFQSQHVLTSMRGLALLINAFNFPAWGLWEKAAPALLAGVPVIAKPATATAWLAQRMVQDVIAADILPAGALSIICGRSSNLMDQLGPFDVVSFTGSARTAAMIRSCPAVVRDGTRTNVEADSLNSAILVPGSGAESESFALLTRETVREMVSKSGQKCTAIRRVLVPEALYDAAAEAIGAKLNEVIVGNPRNQQVHMGSLVSRGQFDAVQTALAALRSSTEVLHDGALHELVDVDPAIAACMGPILLGTRTPDDAHPVHETEVFGPVATLIPYRDLEHALRLVARGGGSLVSSIYGEDPQVLASVALELASLHGRIHVVTPDVATQQTGHGNVMPQSLHGGPGRAGGGQELGGLRALALYQQRSAIQGSATVVEAIAIATVG